MKIKELLDALGIIKNIDKAHGNGRFDINIDNYLFRITGSMPQLVLADPLN